MCVNIAIVVVHRSIYLLSNEGPSYRCLHWLSSLLQQHNMLRSKVDKMVQAFRSQHHGPPRDHHSRSAFFASYDSITTQS